MGAWRIETLRLAMVSVGYVFKTFLGGGGVLLICRISRVCRGYFVIRNSDGKLVRIVYLFPPLPYASPAERQRYET